MHVSFSYHPVTGIRLSEETISGSIGETHQLLATVEPEGTTLVHTGAADIKDYYWESDDENVATIDEKTGLVTFKNAGSTVVRCVSYDGGIYSECRVSTEGDRTALKAAIEKYKNTDYTQYEYEYGMEFKNAYEHAMVVLNDKSMSQENIDAAASALESAGEALATHPYVSVSTINVKYETQSRNLLDIATSVGGGTVG